MVILAFRSGGLPRPSDFFQGFWQIDSKKIRQTPRSPEPMWAMIPPVDPVVSPLKGSESMWILSGPWGIIYTSFTHHLPIICRAWLRLSRWRLAGSLLSHGFHMDRDGFAGHKKQSTAQRVFSGCGHRVLCVPSHVRYLVGGFTPAEKHESIGMMIPNIWKTKCSKPPTRYLFY